MQTEGLSQAPIPMTPFEIEPATFRLVVQCLKKMLKFIKRKSRLQ